MNYQTARLDPEFIKQLRILAAANNMSMAKLSKELAKKDTNIKMVLERLKIL